MFKKAYFRSLPLNVLLMLMGLSYALIMGWLLFYRDRYMGTGYAYNLIPLDTIKRYIFHYDHFQFNIWFKNLFGNIVLFIPIGIFLPLLNTKFSPMLALTAVTITLIAIVELAQMLLKVGSFDVDDIILNTFGALLGWLFYRSVLRVR